jgi:hypothetical protein
MKISLKAGVSAAALVVAMAGMSVPTPVAAQDAATIQAIQRQIQQLQSELRKLQADAATRDAALKAAQAQAKAAEDRAAAAQMQATQTQQTVAALPPAAPPAPKGPLLPKGAFRVGDVTVTLGGFAAAEGIYRSRNQASSIDTNFNGSIPLRSSPNYHIPEYRETAQQSRFSLLVEAQPDAADKLTSFMETDFLSAGTSSNSNQSSSYTLRLRQFFGEWDNSDLGLHVEGGQGWSLATMYRAGLLPRQENVPLTIDAQYVVGFDWLRQAEFRIVKDINKTFWAGISVESPQTLFSGSAGPNCLTGANASTGIGGGTFEDTQCGGSNVNTIQAYSDNYAPDVIAKFAADPGWGHYEAYGLVRFLGGRVSEASSGRNYNTTGEGVGAGMILPLVPKMLDFQVSGLYGRGVGRYGTAQLPDATFSTTGKIEPLTEYSVMGGFVGHPVPEVDVYAYGGAEGVDRKYYSTGAVNSGYGNPNVSLAGCEVELGSCSANTSGVVEGTLGGWYRFIKSNYGTVQAGLQYEYLNRNTFRGAGATKGSSLSPSSNENIFLVSFRYLPFQ